MIRSAGQEPATPLRSDDVFWVHDLGWDGRGVARRSDGRIVFISGAVPGDSVRAEILEEPAKGPVSADLQEVLDPSPQRVAHPCPHYYEGCPASMLGAVRREFSLNWKREHLIETFRRIGGFEGLIVEEVIPSPRQWRYRERLEFTIKREGELLRMGYLTPEGLLPIQDCRLGSEPLEDAYAGLRRALPVLDSEPTLHSTLQMRLLLRENGAEKAVAVLFLLGRDLPDLPPLEHWLNSAGLAGWEIRQAKTINRRFFDSDLLSSRGDPHILRPVAGKMLKLAPTAFAQANARAGRILIQLALEQVPSDSRLLDLYGGFGAFALEHAARGGSASVVDSAPAALESGRMFADEHGLTVSFVHYDLGQTDQSNLDLSSYDVILLDPPRSGATSALLEKLDAEGPSRMIYISCHPAALARDLRKLSHYTTTLVIPVDMFPSTSDLECIAVLDRMES